MDNKYQMIDECNFYVEEINLCIDGALGIVRNYCEYRGMIEGFRQNIEWLDNCESAPIIRYVNNVTRLLRHELITLPWKALECDHDAHVKPARVSTTSKKKRLPGDGVRSLTRAAKLFKLLIDHCDNGELEDILQVCIIKNMTERVSYPVDDVTYTKRMAKLHDICNDVEIILKTIDFTYISAIRHEGIAHSLEISSTRINDNEGILNSLYTVSDLLAFSEKVMELIYKFDRYWRGVNHTNLKRLIENKVEFDQGFWTPLKIGIQTQARQ